MKRLLLLIGLFCLAPPGARAARTGTRVVDWNALRDLGSTDLNRIQRGPRWLDDYDQAVHVADARNGTLLVLFTRRDDTFGARLKRETLADPRVWPHLRPYTLVEVDVDRDPGLAFRYQLRDVPALLWLDSEGRELHRVVGFAPPEDLIAYIDRIRTPGAMELPPEEAGLIERLRENPDDIETMRRILTLLHTGGQPRRLRAELHSVRPTPLALWVRLLEDEALHVRLAALELLEARAGRTFGFDPWETGASREPALVRWQEWADTAKTNPEPKRYTALTRSRMEAAIRDLDRDSPEHVARAVRTLENAGPSLIPHLVEALESGSLSTAQRERLQDILLGLRIAAMGWPDAAGASFRMRRGPLDARMDLLRQVTREGERGLPVLSAFLDDPDVLIRETVMEGLLQAGGTSALPLVLKRLEEEPSGDIALAAMRQMANMRDPRATEWLKTQLESDQEDRMLAALTAMQTGRHDSLAPVAVGLLEDPRWRIRATAATTLGAIRHTPALPELAKRHTDPDAFARTAALDAALRMIRDDQKQAGVVREWYARNPGDLEVLVRVICEHDLTLPDTMVKDIETFDKSDRLALLRVLVDCGESAVPVALSLAEEEDGDVRAASLRLLAIHGVSKSPIEVPNDANRRLARALREESDETRFMILAHLKLPRKRSGSNPFGRGGFVPFVPYTPEGGGGGEDPLDELMGAFSEEPAPEPSGPDPLDELMGAFENPETKPDTPAADSGLSLKAELIRLFEESADPGLQKGAARNLASIGHAPALDTLDVNDPDLNGDLAEDLLNRNQGTEGGLALARRLLTDRRDSIRRVAAEYLAKVATTSDFLPLLDQLEDEKSLIRLNDLPLSGWRVRSALEALKTHETAPFITRWLGEEGEPTPARQVRRSVGLMFAVMHPDSERGELLKPYFEEDSDPDLRALAWLHRISADRALSPEDADTLANDPSTQVRLVLPFVYLSNRSKEWQVSPNHVPGLELTHNNTQGRWTLYLDEGSKSRIQALMQDPMPEVRFVAGLTLLSSGAELETPDAWRDTLAAARQTPWLKSMGTSTLLPIVRSGRTPDPLIMSWLEKDMDAEELSRLTGGGLIEGAAPSTDPADLSRDPAETPDAVPPVIVYVYSRGCGDCEVVQSYLEQYRNEIPDLEIRALDFDDPATVDLVTALYRRAGIPLTEVGLTPMLAGAGYLGAGSEDLTYERIGEIIASSMNGTGAQWIPEPDVLPDAPEIDFGTAESTGGSEAPPSEPLTSTPLPGTPPQGWLILLLPVCLLAFAPLPFRQAGTVPLLLSTVVGPLIPGTTPLPLAAVALLSVSLWMLILRGGGQAGRDSLSTRIQASKKSNRPKVETAVGSLLLVILGHAVPAGIWSSALGTLPAWALLIPVTGFGVLLFQRFRHHSRLRWITVGAAGGWLIVQLVMEGLV